jgi:hypothetical protein
MLDLEPIKTRLELIEGSLCYQEDPVRGDWLVMTGNRVMAVCRYAWEAVVFAHYQKDVFALVEEVEGLRHALDGFLKAVAEDGSKEAVVLATLKAEKLLEDKGV